MERQHMERQHDVVIYGAELGLSEAERVALQRAGVI